MNQILRPDRQLGPDFGFDVCSVVKWQLSQSCKNIVKVGQPRLEFQGDALICHMRDALVTRNLHGQV